MKLCKWVGGLLGCLVYGCSSLPDHAANGPLGAGMPAAMTGAWTFTSDVNGSIKRRNCSFVQQGATFSGTCRDDNDTVQVTGTVNAQDASFKYPIDLFGQTMEVACSGTLSGSNLSGALSIGPVKGTCRLTRAIAPTISAATDRKCASYLGQTLEGATVTRAQVAAATESAPEMCVVRGEMPQDLDFEVRMPTRWNGRTIFIGGGGFDGSIGNELASTVPAAPGEPGYATIATNHGHNNNVTPDATFALNVEMLSEYAYLAVPRVLAPAKAILRAQYGRDFDHAKMVYEGCSGGGRQALIQAQRYPELFDGVVSRAPATAFVPQFLYYAKVAKLMAAPGGGLSPAKFQAIGAAVIAKCDGLDGVQDGIIGRPDMCKFDPAELACKGAETDACLTPTQVATARGFYEPTDVANGRYTWPGFMPGGETSIPWTNIVSKSLIDGFARYMVAQNPNADPLAIDPEKYLSRLTYLSDAIDATDPNLSRFKAHGGKLILWTGQADWLITANNATAYYKSVVDAMGGQESTDDFFEYYTSPSVQHCSGGEGADRFDLVTPMFEWLEKGIKPSTRTIIAMKKTPGAKPFSRPLCQFPRYPKYASGDTASAASFTCAMPDEK